MDAFAGGVYRNPRLICPHHHMLLPRLIRSQVVKGLERPVGEKRRQCRTQEPVEKALLQAVQKRLDARPPKS
ncbi:MAG: hypothetical protein NTW71_10895 [Deltaproteobacteria bacterium]|nr:hypothetical protein [Deltaproteobacteria bacterium]